MVSLQDKLSASGNRPAGFDCLRIALSIAVIGWHGVAATYGWPAEHAYWTGPARGLISAIVPAFFALSGFLVAGSLLRNTMGDFLALRAIRIAPALAFEVFISAVLVGPLVTTLPLQPYFADAQFRHYLLNALGNIHYTLPGVFASNPLPDCVNVQLWTIPYELECYIGIAILGLLRMHRSPRLFALAIFGLCVAATLHHSATDTVAASDGPPPGRFVACCFFAGVSLYLLRHRLPFSGWLFSASAALSYGLLQRGGFHDMACFPMAYCTAYAGLTNPSLKGLGRLADYSYGLYLYGFPVQQVVSQALPQARWWVFTVPVSLAITLALAACSFHLVERPVLARKALVLGLAERVRRMGPLALRLSPAR